jgi:hypothetical protein
MAIVLLQFGNAVLKRMGEIAGDSEALVTSTVTSTATGLTATEAFTDSRRQHKIDIMLQVVNEVAHEVSSLGLFYKFAASATLTLVAAQREYDWPSDFERLAGADFSARVMRGVTNGMVLSEYPGGYAQMLADQPFATQFTGTPSWFAISPVSFKFRLDVEPTSAEAGWTYNFIYERRISLTSTMATDTLPFSDTVADSLVPVVAEVTARALKKEFDREFMIGSLNRALSFLAQKPRKDRYGR